jgi:hypothetical protein
MGDMEWTEQDVVGGDDDDDGGGGDDDDCRTRSTRDFDSSASLVDREGDTTYYYHPVGDDITVGCWGSAGIRGRGGGMPSAGQ